MRLRIILSLVGLLSVPVAAFEGEGQKQGYNRTYGSYWTTESGYTTVVMVNNPTASPQELALQLYSSDGSALAELPILLDPLAAFSLDLRGVAPDDGSGHMILMFPTEIDILPAQALISNGTDAVSLDFEDERNLDYVGRNGSRS